MAYSFDKYTAPGAVDSFAISFDYEDKDELSVRLDGVLQVEGVDFSFTGPSAAPTGIQFTSAPTSGQFVLIRRTTDISEQAVVFSNGNTLVASSLNTSDTQWLNAIQELYDTFGEETMALDSEDHWDALSRRIKNVADAESAQDAVTKSQLDAALLGVLPGSFSDNRIIRADGTGGAIQDSGITINDADDVSGMKVTTTLGSSSLLLADLLDKRLVLADAFGAVGNGTADDTAAIQAALDTGNRVWLTPGKTYKITSTLIVGSNEGLLSDGTAKIKMPSDDFSNTTVGTLDTTSVGIDASGQTSGPFTANDNIILDGFILESEVSDGRYLVGILARNVSDLTIRNLELFGFCIGSGIKLDSVVGNSSVRHCNIHNFTTAQDWSPSTPQISAIDIDNDRVNSIPSVAIDVSSNRIKDLTFTGTALSTHGYQSDGVNVSHNTSKQHRICGNHIETVGDPIDIFGRECVISNNEIIDGYNLGIKLIHGALLNTVSGNSIIRPGLAGILLGSSNQTDAVKLNLISGNTIHDVDSASNWSGSTTAALLVQLNGSPTYSPENNFFCGNKISGGSSTMDYAVRKETGGADYFTDNWAQSWNINYSSVSGGSAFVRNAKKAAVRAHVGSAQTITNGSGQNVVDYDTETIDHTSEYTPATPIYTADSHRRVRVRAQIRVPNLTAAETCILRIRKNSTATAKKEYTASGSTVIYMELEEMYDLSPGDTVDVTVEHDSSSNRTVNNGGDHSYLLIEEIAS